MKTRSPFLALLKFEVFAGWAVMPWPARLLIAVLMLGPSLFPAMLILTRQVTFDFYAMMEIWACSLFLIWTMALGVAFATALVRELWTNVPITAPRWDEFLGTRAINRRMQFRAHTTWMALLFVAPLALNFAVVAWSTAYPELALEPERTGRREIVHVTRFAVGGSQNVVSWRDSDAVRSVASGVLRDASNFTGAVLWAGAATLLALQAYYGLVSRWHRGRGQIAAALLCIVPLLAGMLPTALMNRFWTGGYGSFTSKAGSLFAEHWLAATLALAAFALVTQPFCERRFAEQEVL